MIRFRRRRPTNFVDTTTGKVPPYRLIRRHVLNRDPICRICGVAPSTEVDHVWPLYYGGDDTSENLQGVCSPCNKAKGNTVDVLSAGSINVYAAAEALTYRLDALLDDLDRFDEELTARLVGLRDPAEFPRWETRELLELRLGHLPEVAERIQAMTGAMRLIFDDTAPEEKTA